MSSNLRFVETETDRPLLVEPLRSESAGELALKLTNLLELKFVVLSEFLGESCLMALDAETGRIF